MQNILVTGGAGFIGSNFVRHILRAGADLRVVTLDALTYAGSLENLKDLPHPEKHAFVQGDICDRTLVENTLDQHKIDTIVHFAAESHVDRSILGPGPFVQTNLVGTFTLLESARLVWGESGGFDGRRFHHVSTDEVFGSLGPGDPAFREVTPYDPRSPYSASKAGSDHLVRAYFHTYALPVTLTNCSNNYGPYQFPEKLIPLMILNAIRGAPLPVYGDGLQVRDWLYVEDHCEAIHLVLEKGRPGETYNIGGGNQPVNIEIVRLVCAILDELHPQGTPHERLITHVPDRPGHDRRYAMDITKIQAELGWSPRHTLGSGLRTTVEWYLSRPEWVTVIAQQSGYNEWLEKNYGKRGGGM
ncbi:MAG: dTDP-glucose 4,6-dehydratase [Chloroflexi bacterium]|nr:dTDP-glucose 4,6-dehydratase [Chloroflexota bacterium]